MKKKQKQSDSPPAGRKSQSVRSVLRGLQFKWTAALTTFMFSLVVVGSVLIQRKTEELISRQQNADAIKQCDVIAVMAADRLLNQDRVGLDRIAKGFEKMESVLFIEFFSTSGTLLSEHHRESIQPLPIGRSPSDLTIRELVDRPRWYAPTDDTPLFIDVARNATLADSGGLRSSAAPAREKLVGYVRIGFDLSQIQAGLSAFLQDVRLAGVLAILLMIPIAFMVVRRVTAPINLLNRIVTQFTDGGLRARVDIRRSDEIGQLATAFNTMAEELSTSSDRLVKLNVELEDRVLQRTRQLKDLAERDPLTGLYNRRHLSEVLSRRFAEGERYGNDLACMMIDLDNFKKVNDQFGHEMGDNLLMLTASVISSQMRGADVCARFGGDEFCILLPQTSAEHARKVGQRIVANFEEEIRTQLPDQTTQCGISVGVAGVRELNIVHHDELVKAADRALYEAKDAGKNCVHLAETLA